ncbi:MAG: hypothetical protein R2851_26715 [Caldilineaceae bacterium]
MGGAAAGAAGTGRDGVGASPEARAAGVGVAMSPRQAQTRCPDVLLQPLDLAMCEETQNRFVETLAGWELPVEPLGWGLAYLDLHLLARQADDVRPLAVEMGRQIRRALGDALVPALGWDSGKFTARAAAAHTQPGRAPGGQGPGGLVPDAAAHHAAAAARPGFAAVAMAGHSYAGRVRQTARDRGVAALRPGGQVGPTVGVGTGCAPGAERRAGPVARRHRRHRPAHGLLPPVAATVMDALRAPWQKRRHSCAAGAEYGSTSILWTATSVILTWSSWSRWPMRRAQATLTNNLATLIWPAEASCVRITVHETRELPVQQLTLFAPETPPDVSLGRVADLLRAKYGSVFFRSAYIAPDHPWPNGAPPPCAAMTRLWPQGQPIDVATDSHGRPVRFDWQGRSHRLKQVQQRWQVDTDWWSEEGGCGAIIKRSSPRTGCSVCSIWICWSSAGIWPSSMIDCSFDCSLVIGNFSFFIGLTLRLPVVSAQASRRPTNEK